MNNIRGFTLVELLVAIAIFAVLASMGWKLFEHVSHVKARHMLREQDLLQLQRAYQIFLKDSIQIVPLTVNHHLQPALLLKDKTIALSKAGVTDPLIQAKPAFERIEYVYQQQDKHILRLRYAYLNVLGQQPVQTSIFLSDIDEFSITALNPEETAIWPVGDHVPLNQTLLPQGIKINFTQNGVPYEWVFSLMNTSSQRNNQAVI